MAIDKKYKYLLFDLDGTLCDTKNSIVRCIKRTVEVLHLKEIGNEELTNFVGPPLDVSFKKYYAMSEDEARDAVFVFRKFYTEGGMFEATPFLGIKEILVKLKEQGRLIYVATSKPQRQAEMLLEHLDMINLFDGIYGSDSSQGRKSKPEVIRYLIQQERIIDRKENVLMIGDRLQDGVGAQLNGIDFLIVNYGYAAEGEFDTVSSVGKINSLKEYI